MGLIILGFYALCIIVIGVCFLTARVGYQDTTYHDGEVKHD